MFCQLVGPLVFARITGVRDMTPQDCERIVDDFLAAHLRDAPKTHTDDDSPVCLGDCNRLSDLRFRRFLGQIDDPPQPSPLVGSRVHRLRRTGEFYEPVGVGPVCFGSWKAASNSAGCTARHRARTAQPLGPSSDDVGIRLDALPLVRAIPVPLIPVNPGQPRQPAAPHQRSSASMTLHLPMIPKLNTRVRFPQAAQTPSSAPQLAAETRFELFD